MERAACKLVQGAVGGGEVADALPEGAVVGGEPFGGAGVVIVPGVAEPAEQFADAGTLGADLGLGGLEGVLGVERPLLPGGFGLRIACCYVVPPLFAGPGDGGSDQVAGGGVVVLAA